jgi:hypothetical protein
MAEIKLYKLNQNNMGIMKYIDNAYRMYIPNDINNHEWQEYQKWLSEGNIPEPAYSLEELYNKKYNEVTQKTELLINGNSFVYNNVNFYTDDIFQRNFLTLLVVKDSLTYPYMIWDGNNFLNIADSNEMLYFCQLAITHIQTIRITGKILRDTLKQQAEETDDEYRTRLETFTDLR